MTKLISLFVLSGALAATACSDDLGPATDTASSTGIEWRDEEIPTGSGVPTSGASADLEPVDDSAADDKATENFYSTCKPGCAKCLNLFTLLQPPMKSTWHTLCTEGCTVGQGWTCPGSGLYTPICVPYLNSGACAIDCKLSPCPTGSTCMTWTANPKRRVCMWLTKP